MSAVGVGGHAEAGGLARRPAVRRLYRAIASPAAVGLCPASACRPNLSQLSNRGSPPTERSEGIRPPVQGAPASRQGDEGAFRPVVPACDDPPWHSVPPARKPKKLFNPAEELSMEKPAPVSFRLPVKFVPLDEIRQYLTMILRIACNQLIKQGYTLCEVVREARKASRAYLLIQPKPAVGKDFRSKLTGYQSSNIHYDL